MRSFKSNENIHKKEGGSYYVVKSSDSYSFSTQLSYTMARDIFHEAIKVIGEDKSKFVYIASDPEVPQRHQT